MDKRKSSLFLSPSPHTAQIYKIMQRKMDGEDGQWRCGAMGQAAASTRCPDPVGESSPASQIYEQDMQLALLCPSFFLLRPPLMKCYRSSAPHPSWMRGWRPQDDARGRSVPFPHRNFTRTARETFPSSPSCFFPPLTNLLRPLAFCISLFLPLMSSFPFLPEAFCV